MPHRLNWDPGLATGHATLDAQHRELLEQCNRLADLCADTRAFDDAFAQLTTMAHEHFDAEAAARADDPEALQDEREDFDFLLAEVATTAHFDRVELQRFVALWWLGHIRGQAERLQAPGP